MGISTVIRQMQPRLREIPFSSETKFMAIQCQENSHIVTWHVKGMLEAILPRCLTFYDASATAGSEKDIEDNDISHEHLKQQPMTPQQAAHITMKAAAMARQGLRILAIAKGPQLEKLTFLGLVGISDPPRPGIQNTIESLAQSGVRTM
jgi:Ca2+-transporting ATPase